MLPTSEHDSVVEAQVSLLETNQAVIHTALAQLGKPYKIDAEGPDYFDCSGLVWFCFDQNKLSALIGGGRHRANWYYQFFLQQNLITDVSKAGPGDLVFYGTTDSVTHVGIYQGASFPRPLISALINPYGVSKTRLNVLVDEHGNRLPLVGFGQVQYTS